MAVGRQGTERSFSVGQPGEIGLGGRASSEGVSRELLSDSKPQFGVKGSFPGNGEGRKGETVGVERLTFEARQFLPTLRRYS